MAIHLDELTMAEFEKLVSPTTVVIVPTGAVEAHGDHLPLCTDSLQAEKIAELVAEKLTVAGITTLITPPFRYGNCSSTRNFPGTLSVSVETMRAFIYEICCELARNRIRNIVVLSGHAGDAHMTAQRLGARDALEEHKELNLMVLSDYELVYELRGKLFPPTDGHAGEIETSRLLLHNPELVKCKGRAGRPKFPRFRIVHNPELYWKEAVSGNPRNASTEKGKKIDEYVVRELVRCIKQMVKGRR